MSRYKGKHRVGNTEKVQYHTGGHVHAADMRTLRPMKGQVMYTPWPVTVTVDSTASLEWVDRAVARAEAIIERG